MHQGQIPPPQAHAMHAQYQKQDVSPAPPSQSNLNGATFNSTADAPNAASIDDLISSASKQAVANAAAVQATAQVPSKTETGTALNGTTASPAPAAIVKEDAAEEKTAKKDKDKPKTTRLVYSDNDTSPEEKMALLSRYSFTVEQRSVMA